MNPSLMPTIEFGPVVVLRLLNQIPEERKDVAFVKGGFPRREITAHLADREPILLQQMKAILQPPGATIEAFEGVQRATDRDCRSSAPWLQTDRFAQ